MAKYLIEMKPIKIYGVDRIPEDKKQLFLISLNALNQMMPYVEGVESSVITEEYAILVEGTDKLEESMGKLHDQAIITRLE